MDGDDEDDGVGVEDVLVVDGNGGGGDMHVRINLLTTPGMQPTSITVSPGRNTLYIF